MRTETTLISKRMTKKLVKCILQRTRNREVWRGCKLHIVQLKTENERWELLEKRRGVKANLVMEDERCVGASEGRLGQLPRDDNILDAFKLNARMLAMSGERAAAEMKASNLCGHFGQAVGRGETCIVDGLNVFFA